MVKIRQVVSPEGTERIPYTSAEEAAHNIEEAAWDAAKPLADWEATMASLDSIPRWAEDLYDAMQPADQANVATETKDKIAAKKAHRARKPV